MFAWPQLSSVVVFVMIAALSFPVRTEETTASLQILAQRAVAAFPLEQQVEEWIDSEYRRIKTLWKPEYGDTFRSMVNLDWERQYHLERMVREWTADEINAIEEIMRLPAGPPVFQDFYHAWAWIKAQGAPGIADQRTSTAPETTDILLEITGLSDLIDRSVAQQRDKYHGHSSRQYQARIQPSRSDRDSWAAAEKRCKESKVPCAVGEPLPFYVPSGPPSDEDKAKANQIDWEGWRRWLQVKTLEKLAQSINSEERSVLQKAADRNGGRSALEKYAELHSNFVQRLRQAHERALNQIVRDMRQQSKGR